MNGGAALALELPPGLRGDLHGADAEILAERHAPATDDGWLRGADAIAEYIGAKRSRVYALATCNPPRIPVEHDGSTLVAKRSDLDAWVRGGGGKRP